MRFKHLLTLLILLLTLGGCSTVTTTDEHGEIISHDNSLVEPDFLSDILDRIYGKEELESAQDPVIRTTQNVLKNHPARMPEEVPAVSQENDADSVQTPQREKVYNNVWSRIPDLYQLSDINHPRITQLEAWYLDRSNHIISTSRRAVPFLYFITEEVAKRQLPGEIALLPIIESGFNPKAYSSMKASGLWQFIPSTGRDFGLKQNWWYDGRRDVYLSTHAALTYLQQLNKYYKGDWLLALAAYNAGSGTVNRAIKKNLTHGKDIDFWSLPLPRETQKYIPKLLAMARIIKSYQQHQLQLAPVINAPYLSLVDTGSQLDLPVAARLLNISTDDLHAYNPGFKRNTTDPQGPHHLMVPAEKVSDFKIKLGSLALNERVLIRKHKIRPGDNLGKIARQYRTSIAALKKVNHLKSTRIRAGKLLIIPGNNQLAEISSSSEKTSSKSHQGSPQIYIVRKNDSLWKISRRFNISQKQLAALNNMSAGDTLSIGQKLYIAQQTFEKSVAGKRKIVYEVQSGDSLYAIARQFKVSINALKRWNRHKLEKYLKPGQELKLFISNNKHPS